MRSLFKPSNGLILLLAAVAACGSEMSPSGQPASVDVALSSEAAAAAAARVQATDVDSKLVLDRVFTITPDLAIRFGLPVGTFRLRLQLFADAARQRMLGEGEAQVDAREDVTTEVRVRISADERNADGVAKLNLVTAHAPIIERIDVTFGSPIATEMGARNALIHVTASDVDGSPLAFFWSGLGIQGVVKGGPDFTVVAAQAKLGPPMVFIVVENAAGATAMAKVAFVPVRDCLLCGDFRVMIPGEPERDAAATACLSAHASCLAGCDAQPMASAPHEACSGECGQSLAACLTR
jgi:hypothetical protein